MNQLKNLWKSVSSVVNRAPRSSKQRITEGSNVTRPGATIILTQPQRFGIGLDDYMQGIRSFENVDFTQRVRIYDIYSESLMDPHLFSVVQKRKSGVLGRKIEFRRNGMPDEKVNEQISSPWFLRFLEDALDAQYWGFTLVQFYINDKGWIDYYLVPRKHVDPVLRIIKTRQNDITGESFDDYPDLLMIRGKEPLGVLARCAPYVIYKRGTVGDWAQFSELFGMPIRKYTYDAADPDALSAAMDAARSQGGAATYFQPEGSSLEFVETGNTTGSSELYSSLVDRCNAEMSKAVLGNTLTTEASEKGTQALGTVHNKVEQELVEQDALAILNLLNYDMTEQFAALGVNTAGGEFVYVEEADLAQVKTKAELLEKAVNVFNLPMSDDYLYEQLNIERPDNYDQLKAEMEERKKASNPFASMMQPDDGDTPQQPRNAARQRGFRLVMNTLYQEDETKVTSIVHRTSSNRTSDEEDVSTAFVFDNKALQRSLKRIYEKNFHPMTEIEENLFNETFRIFNEAATEGIAASGAEIPDDFRRKLEQGNAVFSAFKVHRMQNDIAAQLYDSNGVLKPFEQWKNDVHPMLDHHVGHWLRTEYNTAVIRARQAADWQRFEQYADILPNLEWMPSTSAHPGADHKVFWGTILPIHHPFWSAHRPGDRWNCKCSLSATDEPPTGAPRSNDPKDRPAPGLDNNPGRDGKLFSNTHPYVANAYEGAKEAVKKFIEVRARTEGDIFYADPKTGKETDRSGRYFIDPNYGKRLQTSIRADRTEIEENTRAAQALLASFPKMNVKIREHVLKEDVKNPEYSINGKLADRKGIMSEKGITSGFRKAIEQGCEVVIIDLDMHMKDKTLKVRDLARYIDWRRNDFESGTIKNCYVIYKGRAIKIGKADMGRDKLQAILKQLEP